MKSRRDLSCRLGILGFHGIEINPVVPSSLLPMLAMPNSNFYAFVFSCGISGIFASIEISKTCQSFEFSQLSLTKID